MKVDVSLCGVLRHQGSTRVDGQDHDASATSGGELELAEGTTLAQVAAKLGLPEGLGWVACVNGRPVRQDASLTEGDEVYLFLPVSGG